MFAGYRAGRDADDRFLAGFPSGGDRGDALANSRTHVAILMDFSSPCSFLAFSLGIGTDFFCFWSAARLALAGRPAAAFDLGAPVLPWFYPPDFLLAIMPLGLFDFGTALILFSSFSAILWALLIWRVLPHDRIWIAMAAAMPAGLINLLEGQNAFLTAALAGFALIWLDRRPIVAGVLIGLLAIKPQLAVLFPVALLAEGRWRTLAAAAATAGAFTALSIWAFGLTTFTAFIAHLPKAVAVINPAVPVSAALTVSAYGFAISLGIPADAASIIQIGSAIVAAVCVWRVWRREAASFEARAATLCVASVCLSPHIFWHDLTWAALAVGWLIMLRQRTGFRRGEREILLLSWAAPAVMPWVFVVTQVQTTFPVVFALLLIAAHGHTRPRTGSGTSAAVAAH